ncbi:hypothetical protein [Pedobacter sp. MR2016-24]|uniref:hypothetical protein n=1 Tax=Pedobacter sp. MR2016-24 TaxID=2994466 RepID=UPI002247DCC7|nr:hypothetical protein [Pedobacter sp. MR2016-24]MCX2486613.1 hypothetical protein [Pedobacter sp. MR2016-24]
MATPSEAELVKRFMGTMLQKQLSGDNSPLNEEELLNSGFSKNEIETLKRLNQKISD